MILKDISFASPIENILYDEVLLHLAENGAGAEILRLWESPTTFVVLGRARKMEDDLKMSAVQRDKIPVLMRLSGGGTVIQGRGCLNYSLILSKGKHPAFRDLHQSYQAILGIIAKALQGFHIPAIFRPISDLVLADTLRKFSGNAQHRGRTFFLQHGTILYDLDFDLVEKYLHIPDEVPVYRQGRSHKDFLVNIPLSARAIKKILKDSFQVSRAEDLTESEKNSLAAFVRDQSQTIMFHGQMTAHNKIGV